MATNINDQLKNLSPKPLDFYLKKQVGSTWVDWASISEVQAAVPPSFLPNKEFYIAGVLYRTDNSGAFSVVNAVSAESIGLGNVDNTSDINKPVSAAQAAVNATKENLSNKTNTFIPNNTDTNGYLSNKGSADLYTQAVTNVTAQILGTAIPTTDPTTVTGYDATKFQKFSINNASSSAGTYTHFLDNTSTAIAITTTDLGNGKVELWGIGGVWSKNIIPVDLTGIVTPMINNALIPYAKLSTSVNIANTANAQNGYYYSYGNGALSPASTYIALLVPIQGNQAYEVPAAYTDQTAFFDANMNFISGIAQITGNMQFTSPANAAFVGLSLRTWNIATFMLCLASQYPTSYQPYSVTIKDFTLDASQIIGLNNSPTIIYVNSDTSDTGANFTGNDAIQTALSSITDNSIMKPYQIIVKGNYTLTLDKITGIENGYYSGIICKDYVDIIGESMYQTSLTVVLPSDDASMYNGINRGMVQTIYNYSNCNIKNISFIIYNGRYTLHQDDGREANKTRTYESCAFVFHGNHGNLKALGIGTWSNSITKFVDCNFGSDINLTFAIHNQVGQLQKSAFQFTNCTMLDYYGWDICEIQNDGSLLNDEVVWKGTNFGCTYKLYYADYWINTPSMNTCYNHAEWRMLGSGNNPVLFINTVLDYSLGIRSTSTGSNSTVRFDTTSSAYSVLIQNPRGKFGMLNNLSRQIQDEYLINDGSIGLSGYAFGAVGMRQEPYINGITTTNESIGIRLGDCSTANKVLNIIIDGTSYKVTFNQNYSALSNQQVLAIIQTAIGSAGTAYFHNIGQEYYLEWTDVLSEGINGSTTTPILKGTIVSAHGGRLFPTTNTDDYNNMYVAIDDIPISSVTTTGLTGIVGGRGRIVKKCFIQTDNTQPFFVAADSTPVGNMTFSVNNGQLISDPNGHIRTIDTGVVAIGC